MPDRTISTTLVSAILCWGTGLVLIVYGMYDGHPTGQLGLLIAGGGGVLSMRRLLCQMTEARERNAFELGRDWAEIGSVRSLSRVPEQRR